MRVVIPFIIATIMSTVVTAQTLPTPQAVTDPKQIVSKPNAQVEKNLSIEKLKNLPDRSSSANTTTPIQWTGLPRRFPRCNVCRQLGNVRPDGFWRLSVLFDCRQHSPKRGTVVGSPAVPLQRVKIGIFARQRLPPRSCRRMSVTRRESHARRPPALVAH